MSKSKYHKDFPLMVEGWLRDGLTDKEICKRLGVSEATYYEYQKKHPEFLKAVQRGKAPIDIRVENALLKRALGFEYEEKHHETRESNGKVYEVEKVVKKKALPDVTAQIFWLKNRKPRQWRDVRNMQLTGKDGGPIETKQDLSALSKEELLQLLKLTEKLRKEDEAKANKEEKPKK